jgi:hypothetical protein
MPYFNVAYILQGSNAAKISIFTCSGRDVAETIVKVVTTTNTRPWPHTGENDEGIAVRNMPPYRRGSTGGAIWGRRP